jgi:hypothetical protein
VCCCTLNRCTLYWRTRNDLCATTSYTQAITDTTESDLCTPDPADQCMLDNVLVGWQIMHRMKEDPADGCRVRHYGSLLLTPGALHRGALHTGLRLLLCAFLQAQRELATDWQEHERLMKFWNTCHGAQCLAKAKLRGTCSSPGVLCNADESFVEQIFSSRERQRPASQRALTIPSVTPSAARRIIDARSRGGILRRSEPPTQPDLIFPETVAAQTFHPDDPDRVLGELY